MVTSFLGLHALPPSTRTIAAAMSSWSCGPMLRALAEEGLADAVDAFCEGIAFTPDEVAELFAAARALGLPVKLHADQLSDTGGAALAARFGALSADHVEYAGEAGARAMAAAGTVAVLLPGAFYLLRETQAPAGGHRSARHGVPMAVATDANPGTSPLLAPLLALNMACVLFGLTPEEALAGMTRVAAQALGLRTEASSGSGRGPTSPFGASGARPSSATGSGLQPLELLVKDGRTVTTAAPAAAPPRP